MPVSPVTALIRRLQDVILGARDPAGLEAALVPLIDVLDRPELDACSTAMQDPFLEHIVRSAVGRAAKPPAKTWPLGLFDAPSLGVIHGRGVVDDSVVIVWWVRRARRGLVVLLDLESADQACVLMPIQLG